MSSRILTIAVSATTLLLARQWEQAAKDKIQARLAAEQEQLQRSLLYEAERRIQAQMHATSYIAPFAGVAFSWVSLFSFLVVWLVLFGVPLLMKMRHRKDLQDGKSKGRGEEEEVGGLDIVSIIEGLAAASGFEANTSRPASGDDVQSSSGNRGAIAAVETSESATQTDLATITNTTETATQTDSETVTKSTQTDLMTAIGIDTHLEDEIKVLREQLVDERQFNSTLQDEKKRATEKINTLEDKVKVIDRQLTTEKTSSGTLKSSNSRLHDDVKDISNKLTNERKTTRTLQEEIEKARTFKTELEYRLEEITDKLDSAEAEISTLKEDKKGAKEGNTRLRSELKDADEKLAEKEAEISTLRGDNKRAKESDARLKSELKVANDKLAGKETANSSLQKEIKTVTDLKFRLESDLELVKDQLDDERANASSLQKEVDRLTNHKSCLEDDFKGVGDQLTEAREIQAELRADLRIANNKYNKSSAEITGLKREVDSQAELARGQRITIIKLENQIQTLNDQVSLEAEDKKRLQDDNVRATTDSSAEVANLRNQIKAKVKELDAHREANINLENKLKAVDSQLSQAKTTASSLKLANEKATADSSAEIEKLNDEVATRVEELANNRSELNEKAKRLTAQDREIAELKRQVNAFSGEASTAMESLKAKHQDELTKLNSQSDDMIGKLMREKDEKIVILEKEKDKRIATLEKEKDEMETKVRKLKDAAKVAAQTKKEQEQEVEELKKQLVAAEHAHSKECRAIQQGIAQEAKQVRMKRASSPIPGRHSCGPGLRPRESLLTDVAPEGITGPDSGLTETHLAVKQQEPEAASAAVVGENMSVNKGKEVPADPASSDKKDDGNPSLSKAGSESNPVPIEDSKKGETSSNIPDAPSAPSAPGQASSEGVSSPQAPQTASVPEPASSEGTSSTQIPGIPSAPAQGSSEGAPSSMADSGEPTLPTLTPGAALWYKEREYAKSVAPEDIGRLREAWSNVGSGGMSESRYAPKPGKTTDASGGATPTTPNRSESARTPTGGIISDNLGSGLGGSQWGLGGTNRRQSHPSANAPGLSNRGGANNRRASDRGQRGRGGGRGRGSEKKGMGDTPSWFRDEVDK